MNRRTFLQSLFASTAVIVVAPADVLDDLPAAPDRSRRTYVDMGRRSGLVWLDPLDALLGPAEDGAHRFAVDDWYRDSKQWVPTYAPGLRAGSYFRQHGRWRTLDPIPYPIDPLDLRNWTHKERL